MMDMFSHLGGGLVVAGPLCFLISALADRDTRAMEVVVYAVLSTVVCGFLFKEMLSLPIPFDPLNILWPVHGPYEAAKAAVKALVLGR